MKWIKRIFKQLFAGVTIFFKDILKGFEMAEMNRHHCGWGKF